MKVWPIVRGWLKAPTFSPTGFLVRAAAYALVYAILSLCGLRQYMSMLSLTVPEGSSRGVAFAACIIYLISYFFFILGTPIFILAAGLLAASSRVLAARPRQPATRIGNPQD